MAETVDQITSTIAVLEAQRAILGDAVVDVALAPLRRELAALNSREPPAVQQLKQVSVLFIDVVGSTAIGQTLGPEEIHAVMDTALERFTSIVQAHHGRVLQYTGDGMLAAFGSEEANEDDVESAINAALCIIGDAEGLAVPMRERHGIPEFNVRAGVHTGTVLLGGGVDAEGSIRGATVNVAARMEQSAPAGRLRISHDSYRHVRGLFDVTEQAPISVKGVEVPLRTYLVDRVKPRAFRVPTRGIEGMQTRMVGRAAELEVLCASFDEAVFHRRAHVVHVVGEAGHGSGSRPSTWSVPVKPRDASRTTRNSAVVAKLITMAVKTSACGSGSAKCAGSPTPPAARIGAAPVRSRPMAIMKRLTA
jgi:class 3 adenylate cyclase